MHGCSFINSFNRKPHSTYATIILVYNSNINCRRVVESMSFKTEFAKRAKVYLGEDLDEKIIIDAHKELFDFFYEIKQEIGTVKNPKYQFIIMSGETVSITIDDTCFEISVNIESNTLDIKRNSGMIEQIIVRDGEPYSTKSERKFDTNILEEYLKEIFGEKLGL